MALSPNCLRVRAVARELDLDLEIVSVDFTKGETSTDAFLALNPNGKVPVLVDDDFVLWESRAITAYLASKRPERGLCPTEPRARAIVDQCSFWQAIHLGPPMQKVAFERVFKPRFGLGQPDETLIDQQLKEAHRYLSVLDKGLGDRTWVAGDHLTIADFAVASTFVLREPAGIALTAYPNVTAWITRMESRPSWAHATAPMLAFARG